MSKVRQLREAGGLTLRETAEHVGTSHSTIARWEQQGYVPEGHAATFARAVGASPADVPTTAADAGYAAGEYVASEQGRSAWRDAVFASDLSSEAKLILTALAVPQLLNQKLWIIATTIEEFLEVVKLDPAIVAKHWEEAISSPFVERVGAVEYVFRLRFGG